MTTEQMAEKIGVSNSFYTKIERGERNPSFNFIGLFKLAFPMADIDVIFFKNKPHETCR